MKRLSWEIPFGIFLIILSIVVYILHYYIFRDPHHIFIYMLGDLAFVFIEVLLVTLIIHRLLTAREKRSMLNKLNMVIGTFYSEVGIDLLKKISKFDSGNDKIRKELFSISQWSDKEFLVVNERLKKFEYSIVLKKSEIKHLKAFLLKKRKFLLTLLENPNLLEHETFTDLLWAVFHLVDELAHREKIEVLPKSDIEHITGDIKRAYGLLVTEWLIYMKHLKNDYPYLFSLAVRTNPFDPKASVVIK